ncbi:Autolysin sensor kinase [hydrothermal vent metagenome]|uniref:Autolysin sensor kinase n=1 Tax=hydrothermal vent metagenome TaxID=652676 RepID=A0A3B0V594_9ZZZZ
MNKQRAYWVIQSIGWSLYALILILGGYVVSNKFQPLMAMPILVEAMFFFVLTHFYRILNKKWHWFHLPVLKLLPKMLVSIFVMAIPIYFIRVFVSYLLDIYSPNLLSANNIIGNIIGNFFALFIWTSLYYAFHYFERYNLSLKYEVAMKRMELDRLKSQLNPHFIFNALNSIRALVDENPSKSKQAINHLSNILRSSLSADRTELILFREEMETVQDYLAMETIRFEERLNFNIDISNSANIVLVPPLMFQTLVENGIKHGISKLKKGGKITINAFVKDKYLIVEIRNTGVLHKNAVAESGYGIKNTIQRLEIIFNGKAEFKISNESKNMVLTLVQIPIGN